MVIAYVVTSKGVQYHLELVCASRFLPSHSGGFSVWKSSGIGEFDTCFGLIEVLVCLPAIRDML